MKENTLYLIDGYNLIYRFYYAHMNFKNSKGLSTGSIYGWAKFLESFFKEYLPEQLCVIFDSEKPSFRKKEYEKYKANRAPTPEPIIEQIDYIKQLIAAYGISILKKDGYEADDIIAYITQNYYDKFDKIYIITSDKDLFQLINDKVTIFDYFKDKKIYDKIQATEKFSIDIQYIPDLLGLQGDASDNIPGVKGIGEKTAVKLINEYGTIEEIYENIENIKSDRYKKLLNEGKDLAFKSKELAILKGDFDIEINDSDFIIRKKNEDIIVELFTKFDFKSLLNEYMDVIKDSDKIKTQKLIIDYCDDIDSADVLIKSIAKNKKVCLILFEKSNDIKELFISIKKHCINVVEKGNIILYILKNIFVQEEITIITYGVKQIWKYFLYENTKILLKNNVYDIKLMDYLLNSGETNYSLENIIKRHVSNLEEIQYEKISMQKQLELFSDNDDTDENKIDISVIEEVYKTIDTKMDSDLFELYNNIDYPLSYVLAEIEFNGIKIDADIIRNIHDGYNLRLNELSKKIYEYAGEEFNINSSQQLAVILFEKLNLPVKKKIKTGYSTNAEVLNELKSMHPLPEKVLEYRNIQKIDSTYTLNLLDYISEKDGRIHTMFNQCGTATGRLSSSKPNMQNIPIKTDVGKVIRKAFVSDQGKKLISVDYSQIELRILAHLSNDKIMVNAFKNNKDIHSATAYEIFDVNENEELEPYQRRFAKMINFAIIYGMQAFSLSKELGVSRKEADNYIKKYFDRYKGIKTFLDNTIDDAHKTEISKNMFGRIRYLYNINSSNYNLRSFSERVATNSPIQSSAADIIKKAMIKLNKYFKDEDIQCKMLLQIHDELIFEVDEDIADDIKTKIIDIMENIIPLNIPLTVDSNIGGNLYDIH